MSEVISEVRSVEKKSRIIFGLERS